MMATSKRLRNAHAAKSLTRGGYLNHGFGACYSAR